MIKLLKTHYHTKYHGVYQHAKKLFIFDLALLFTAIVMLAGSVFLFFWKPGLTDLIDLSISLGSDRIKSGEEVRLTIQYTNRSKQKLTDVSLGIKLPEGFVVDRSKTPLEVFSDHSLFTSVKELPAGASGQAEVHGQLWVEPKKETRITTNLSYRPENKNSREQKLSSMLANLSESVLDSKLDFPNSAFSNSIVKFIYTIKNNSQQKIDKISIANNWDKNLIPEKDASNISLPPGETKKIEGQIKTGSRSGDQNLIITPQILANNHLIPQLGASQNFKVLAPQIEARTRLIEAVAYGEPGQMIPIEVAWENKSGFKLENTSLHLAANHSGVVDWRKTAVENNAKFEPNGMFFDHDSRTSLSSGATGSPDTFTVKIYLLKTFSMASAENARLEIYPTIKAGTGEIAGQQFSHKGSAVGFPLATEVKFSNVEARYFTEEGDQLGRGPLPPKVGKTTKYWIFVKIHNSSNIINDAEFKTSLPEGVEFTGKQSTAVGPQIKYNPADRSLSWQYYTLPANSKTGLYFEVAVTPDASQVGQNIRLTNTFNFSATDEFVGKKINISYPAVNNILNRNDDGFGSGSKVVP